METNIEIEGGKLIKCITNAMVIDIPEGVNQVEPTAFDNCPNLKKIYYPRIAYHEVVEHLLWSLQDTYGLPCGEDDDWDECGGSTCVYGIPPEMLDKAIQESITRFQAEEENIDWKLVTINANLITQDMRDASLLVNEDTLPIIKKGHVYPMPWPAQWLERERQAGYGILYIRDVNKDNYPNFPPNFTYSLTKHHNLLGGLLGRKWHIIIGSNTAMDVQTGSTLDKYNSLSISLHKFIEYINTGKI